MADTKRTIFACSCEKTMPLDADALRRGLRGANVETANHLCRAELDRFRAALAAGAPLTVGCTQEAPLFSEIAAETASETPLTFANVRETAGWSKDAAAAGPKMAALLAMAAEPLPETPLVPLSSEGVVLVYGRDERTIEAANLVKDKLDVTVLLTKPGDIAPRRVTEFPVVKGTIRSAKGHLGAFELLVDDYAAPLPSSRDKLAWAAPKNGATSNCDLIIDLSGGAPLFPAHDLRDGYLRADPGDPAAVLRVLLKAADLVGTFDKPRYITFTDHLCAHSRSKIVGCHRCLDLCPTGAITPAGDHVKIDEYVCAGCGACASVCPTGAAAYALPPADAVMRELRTLLNVYREAGGNEPDPAAARCGARRRDDRRARPPRRRAAGQRAAARRQRSDASGPRKRSPPPSPMARRRCAFCCAPSRVMTWPPSPRPSRSPSRSSPGSASARTASPRSRPMTRTRSAQRSARSSPGQGAKVPATFQAVGAKRDVLRLGAPRTAPGGARAGRRGGAPRRRAVRQGRD